MRKLLTFVLIFCSGLIICPAQDLNRMDRIDAYSKTIRSNLSKGNIMELWMETRTGLLDVGYDNLDCFIICQIPEYTGEAGKEEAESAISQFLTMYMKENVIKRSQISDRGTRVSSVRPNGKGLSYWRYVRHIEIRLEN